MPREIEEEIQQAQRTVEREKERRNKERRLDPERLDEFFERLDEKDSVTQVVFKKLKVLMSYVISILIIIAALFVLSKLFSGPSYDRDDYIEPRAPDDYRVWVWV